MLQRFSGPSNYKYVLLLLLLLLLLPERTFSEFEFLDYRRVRFGDILA